MKITIEISLYPLDENYIPPIDNFLQRIHQYPDIKISTNATSTHICGESEVVFELLKREITQSFENMNQGIFVSKILKGELI